MEANYYYSMDEDDSYIEIELDASSSPSPRYNDKDHEFHHHQLRISISSTISLSLQKDDAADDNEPPCMSSPINGDDTTNNNTNTSALMFNNPGIGLIMESNPHKPEAQTTIQRGNHNMDAPSSRCHCLPWFLGYRIAGELSLRVKQLEVRCEMKTKDHAFVTVVATVQYRALADKASDAFYRLSNIRGQIQSYIFDVIRASAPKLELDAVLEQKNDIAKSVEEELEKAMSTYGYQIVQTLIVDIEPDTNVKRSMNEINAAANKKSRERGRVQISVRTRYGSPTPGHCRRVEERRPCILRTKDVMERWY
ncbi:hypothetical protein AHAS_Ahas14G0187600 [Arachis hypogaea]